MFLICINIVYAQPQKINYQAVAIDASGLAVKNKVISLRLSILDSSSTGSVLYSETHQPTTDGSGQFSVYLGGGTVVSGTFSNIPWGNAKSKFLKTESDYAGGSNYSLMGVSQLVSVPYALAAESAKKLVDSAGNIFEVVYINGVPTIKTKISVALNNSTSVNCGQDVLYENELYPTIQIGSQCWFAKNLNVGELISTGKNQSNNNKFEKYCADDNLFKCSLLGGLYQWAEAVNYTNGANNDPNSKPVFVNNLQGICPSGWHIPTNLEFCNLATFIDPNSQCNQFGGNSNSANYLKSQEYWYLDNSNLNSYNFSALPAGFRQDNFYIGNLYYETYFWTVSFSNTSPDPIIWELKSQSNAFNKNVGPRSNGFSIRCVKD